ncbi:endoplasmic reticulum-Golgi intermediate compartment protein 2 isoform X2 [Leptopilina boulardi]|uniref:endoplasmic reticulum-Golgi intermediate compartment protein 2 isoform X2 n=1 Tax=Leptopilina boulardi TaxID=63433 RepID=UPI0021F68B25|nr:endoplasmic reticulum-Golgi intermediate compartment protein 2 isoform X2 [Leptopilina boulardi]
MLRRRKINFTNVKSLDAFPKIAEHYTKQSAVGGTFSVITFCIIVYLITAETWYFLDSKLKFKFVPDTEINTKLKINIDITVAMPCDRIGADILDSTNQNFHHFEKLKEEDTWWDLSHEQRSHFDALKTMNLYFREEYHAIHDLLWKSNQIALLSEMPKRSHEPNYPPDACRIHGSLSINKVSGNFHITSGKSLSLPGGHIHISAFVSENEYNFTHRINRFSFGEPSPGIIHPLEGEEKVTNESSILFQYFIDVVPTDIDILLRKTKTFQYSVKDHERPINHNKGQHGIPGIFFKYDTSALKVKVFQQRDSLYQFFIKLCATVGGIYVTSGLINNLVQLFWKTIFCHQEAEPKAVKTTTTATNSKSPDLKKNLQDPY